MFASSSSLHHRLQGCVSICPLGTSLDMPNAPGAQGAHPEPELLAGCLHQVERHHQPSSCTNQKPRSQPGDLQLLLPTASLSPWPTDLYLPGAAPSTPHPAAPVISSLTIAANSQFLPWAHPLYPEVSFTLALIVILHPWSQHPGALPSFSGPCADPQGPWPSQFLCLLRVTVAVLLFSGLPALPHAAVGLLQVP